MYSEIMYYYTLDILRNYALANVNVSVICYYISAKTIEREGHIQKQFLDVKQ